MSDFQKQSPDVVDAQLVKPAKSSSNKTLLIILAAVFGVMALIIVMLAALLLPAVAQVRKAAKRVDSQNRIRQLIVSMHNYHDIYKQLPEAHTLDADGNPLHSWRTAMLPMLESAAIHDSIDQSAPWNAGPNTEFHDSYVAAAYYQSGRCQQLAPGVTNFAAVVDTGTVLQPGKAVTLEAIPDGVGNTAILIEFPDSDINWMEPRDVTIAEAIEIIQSSSLSGGTIVGFADGSAHAIPSTTSAEEIRGLFLADDGKGRAGYAY